MHSPSADWTLIQWLILGCLEPNTIKKLSSCCWFSNVALVYSTSIGKRYWIQGQYSYNPWLEAFGLDS